MAPALLCQQGPSQFKGSTTEKFVNPKTENLEVSSFFWRELKNDEAHAISRPYRSEDFKITSSEVPNQKGK